jgi:hypothetical protein
VEECAKKSGRFVSQEFGEQVFLTTLGPFLLNYSRFCLLIKGIVVSRRIGPLGGEDYPLRYGLPLSLLMEKQE